MATTKRKSKYKESSTSTSSNDGPREKEAAMVLSLNLANLAAAAGGGVAHNDADLNPDPRTAAHLLNCIQYPTNQQFKPNKRMNQIFFYDNVATLHSAVTELARRFPYLRYNDPSHPNGPVIEEIALLETDGQYFNSYYLATPFF